MQRWVADESRNHMERSVRLTGVSARQEVEETAGRCSQQGGAACFSPLKLVSHYISGHASDRGWCFSRCHKVLTPTYLTKKEIFFKRHKMTRHSLQTSTRHQMEDFLSPSVFISCVHLIIFDFRIDFLISVLPFLNREKVFRVSQAKLKLLVPRKQKLLVWHKHQTPPDFPEQTLCFLYSHANRKTFSSGKSEHFNDQNTIYELKCIPILSEEVNCYLLCKTFSWFQLISVNRDYQKQR